MIHDPAPDNGGPPFSGSPGKRVLPGVKPTRETNRIGLMPTEGWRRRNLQFLGEILIPSLLSARKPGRVIDGVPLVGSGEMGVTWLGHAGFFAQIAGVNLLIDPNWALWHGPIKRLRHPSVWASDLPPIDLVLVTHAHYDHLHMPSLRRVARGQPIIVPKGVGSIVKRAGFGQIVELETWQRANFRDLHIMLTPARHWGARMIHDTHRGFGGYLITSPGRTLFHCGDSSMFDGFQEIGKRADIDLALMPIGAYLAPSGRPVHMNPEEALDAFDMLGARHMVPMHHDTFPLGGEPIHEPAERLAAAAIQRQLQDRVRILHEGESVAY
ncbi:L-ascorbate metabolism protein UlaG (beta-lactamase superfamily) [Prosthecobacter fusiformis]|uniref:L-ascorbate metabolism protein UlaG (Beta-lactamase superfamily) n=1 Tax=Prosthecobacter fusiformis TaxID=48464 RepID=A0A4R7SRY8_9BACT|nr:MBL fold metallo-hydrolase [Prosthecobacter fusiformis]TDU81485.1 L-ascorbate metabolism protein UlaG (beta-lactamase superfamily) [Prosthecobacter fusiformis]